MVIASIAVTFLIALFPAAIWLAFFLREDAHPEPRPLLFKVFFYGALSSIPAFFIQFGLREASGARSFTEYSLLVVFLLAACEEALKWGAAWRAARKDSAFDEPVDAMVYSLVAGLGFATVENLFVAGAAVQSLGAGGLVSAGETLLLRMIGATLLHTLASALIGYYWARGVFEGREKIRITMGVLIASAVHTVFNLLVYAFQSVNLLYPTLFLVAFSFFILRDFEALKRPKA